tara:strand:- start:788 stop:1249 length:462 start_codon:yes stop_codon:yes gene_type:complete
MTGKGIPKKIIRDFVRHVDILPTICDILDFKISKKINGVSLKPLIEGKKFEENIQYLHTMPYEKPHEDDSVGIRTNEYKYFRSSKNSEKNIHLYNVQKDPYENHNIAHKNKEIVKKFEEELKRLTKDRIEFDEQITDEDDKKIEEELKKMGYL